MLRLRLLIGMCLFVACSSRIRCSHWWTSTRYPLKKIYLWFVRKFPAFLRQFIPSISVSVVTKTHKKKKCVSSTNPYSFQISVTKENKKKKNRISFPIDSIRIHQLTHNTYTYLHTYDIVLTHFHIEKMNSWR